MTDHAGEKRALSRGRRTAIVVVGAMLAVAGAAMIAGAAYLVVRGPSAASGDVAGASSAPLAELPADASRWVNGAPISLAAARDKVLLVEAWHPA